MEYAMPWDHPELASYGDGSRSAEVTFTEIIEISYATQWDDMWWSLPKDMSADLMLEFREGGDVIEPITFEWEWQGKQGTKRGPDGEPTNISSYTLNFDRMEQKNNDTGVVRKFRVVQVGME